MISKDQVARSAKEDHWIFYSIHKILQSCHFQDYLLNKNELRMSHVAKLAIYCLYPFHETIYLQKLEGDWINGFTIFYENIIDLNGNKSRGDTSKEIVTRCFIPFGSNFKLLFTLRKERLYIKIKIYISQ